MQILKGTKDRTPDYNEYVYSKGSVYRDDDLDKMARMSQACKEALHSNDYSGADKALTEGRKKKVETILTRYNPLLVLSTPYEELTERNGDMLRWDAMALTMLSLDPVRFTLFQRGMDYMIVKPFSLNAFIHHTDEEFKTILNTQLSAYEAAMNNLHSEE